MKAVSNYTIETDVIKPCAAGFYYVGSSHKITLN